MENELVFNSLFVKLTIVDEDFLVGISSESKIRSFLLFAPSSGQLVFMMQIED